MWLAGPSLGRELRARALSHTAPVPAWHRLRSQSPREVAYRLQPHTTNGRRHQAQQPWREEHVGRHVPGLVHHVGAEWRGAQNGCSRTGRARWAMPPPLQRCTARCTVRAPLNEAAASETSGLSVGGCIRARGYFGPYPSLPATVPRIRELTPLSSQSVTLAQSEQS